MSFKPKTRRRLLFLALAVVSVSALAGGFVALRKHQNRVAIAHARTLGLAAYQAQSYPDTLTHLAFYLKSNPSDLEALTAYAQARLRVEEPNARHLLPALSLWKRLVDLQPDNLPAKKTVLDLYTQVGYSSEALALANEILFTDTLDDRVWRAKAIALLRLRRFTEARHAADRVAALLPLNLEAHLLILNVMVQAPDQSQFILPYAAKLAAAHPDDPRFETIHSIACSLAADQPHALSWARLAASRENIPADALPILVNQLDNLEEFTASTRLLERCALRDQNRETRRQLVARLYQSERWQEVLTHTLPSPNLPPDTTLTALRAMTFFRLQKTADARPLLAALLDHPLDRNAPPISRVLSAYYLDFPQSPEKLLPAAQEAQGLLPQDPFLNYFLAKAYLHAGERDLALEHTLLAARFAPAWGLPWVDAAQLQLAIGRTADAYAAAQAAQKRLPENRDVAVVFALATGAKLQYDHSPSVTPDVLQNALQLLLDIEKRWPDESRALPLHVQLLVRQKQRDAASQLIQSSLLRTPPVPEKILLQLAMVSQDSSLNLVNNIFDASQKAHGLTPDLAFSQALHLLKTNRPDEALKLLDTASHNPQNAPADVPAWAIAWATFLDIAGDSRAAPAWVALGDAYPNNVSLQWSALSARCVQRDNDFIGRTIDRLRTQLGDHGLTWRFARARWLLLAKSGEKDAAEASLLLGDIARSSPDLLAPRLLLAECMERLGNTSEAIQHLSVAATLRPDSHVISLELARLLLLQGNSSAAGQHAQRVIASDSASPTERYRAATYLAQIGQFDVALAVIEKLYPPNSPPPPDLILARLYLQQNQPEKAAAIAQVLLQKPSPAIIQFAADLFASIHRPADAQAALNLLDSVTTTPLIRHLVRGGYYSRFGDPQRALEAFALANAADPANPAVWRERIAISFSLGKIPEALAALKEAHKAVPGDPVLASADSHAALLLDASSDPTHRALLVASVQGVSESAAALESLKLLQQSRNLKLTRPQLLAKLTRLATQYPRVLAVQSLLIQVHAQAGNIDEAITLATRTMQIFPSSPEPAQWATNSLALAQRWSEVLPTAREWRDRSLARSFHPDLAIASAQLQLGQVEQSLRQIDAYIPDAKAQPEKYPGVILLYAQALLKNNRYPAAENLLKPLLKNSPEWRKIWIALAARSVNSDQVASAWLEHAYSVISPTSLPEKLQLAHAWITLGQRLRAENPTALSAAIYLDYGHTLIESLGHAPDASPDALLALALHRESLPNLPAAVEAYRRLLKLQPDSHIAQNNLAAILLQKEATLPEALTLVDQAIAASPRVPNYHDTRAEILLRQHNLTAAAEALQTAISLAPTQVEWRINLITLLSQNGQTEKAQAALRQLQSLAESRSLTPQQQKKLSATGLR